jgi:hypothetical protein
VLGNELSEFGLISSTHFCNLGTSLVKVERGHGFNATVGGNIVGIIYIDLDGLNFRIFGCKLFKDWTNEFAGSFV